MSDMNNWQKKLIYLFAVLAGATALGSGAFLSYWYANGIHRYKIAKMLFALTAGEAPLGASRPAAIHLPDNYSEDKKWPLVLSLHGYMSFPEESELYIEAVAKRNTHGYIIISPLGSIDRKNNHYWDAGKTCCSGDGEPVDDVSYLLDLVKEAQARYQVDDDRIYLLGISNGAYMGYRLACEDNGLFKGMLLFSGLSPKQACDAKPRNIIHFHGTSDELVPYADLDDEYAADVETGLSYWAQYNECEQKAQLKQGSLHLLRDESIPSEHWQWNNCTHATIHLFKQIGAGHIPWFSKNPIDLAWPLLNKAP